MNVRDVMTRDVATCRAEQTASDAARAMWDRDCGFVPVVDGGRLVGVVTDRDLLMAARIQGKNPNEVRLASLVQSPVAVCRPEDDLDAALEVMARRQVRRLPVVEAPDRLVGVLSLNDVALHAVGDELRLQRVAETLAAICRHREPETACP
jgi:CBS domain-containing protein